MKEILNQAWTNFKSEVPPIVKKIQIILGLAATSLGTIAAISWPGKSAVIGEVCGYGAAGCLGVITAIQFIQQTVTVLEKTETKVVITQTTTSTALPVDEKTEEVKDGPAVIN